MLEHMDCACTSHYQLFNFCLYAVNIEKAVQLLRSCWATGGLAWYVDYVYVGWRRVRVYLRGI